MLSFVLRRPRKIRAGALALFVLLSGAAGCGGSDDSSKDSGAVTTAATPAGAASQARVAEITSCLKKAGQTVDQPKAQSPGATVLSVPLQTPGTVALIYVYSSPAEASKAEQTVSGFFSVRGGTAKATGDVVLAQNVKTLPAAQEQKIKACF